MSALNRHLPSLIDLTHRNVLDSPMIFITGPRQVGKTYETRNLTERYFNWDTSEVKKSFLKDPYFFRSKKEWIVFDEIHKRKKDWKKILKGYYDSPDRNENFIITGSGRFDHFQKGGDSLQGRYDLYHLLPITFDEILHKTKLINQVRDFTNWEPDSDSLSLKEQQDHLIKLGGFPAPFNSGSERVLNKWKDQYIERLVYEDVRDFNQITLLDKMELLGRLLPTRVGSPLSLQSLSEDLEVSRDSIKTWIRIFETLYLGFSIPPYSKKIHRSVKKERKWYFFQWTYCAENPGALFENYLAVQLYSACRYWRDQGLGHYELHYLRDQDRREVDFLITKNLNPVVLVESKIKPDTQFPTALKYYCNKLKIPGFLLTQDGQTKRHGAGQYSVPAHLFLKNLSGA